MRDSILDLTYFTKDLHHQKTKNQLFFSVGLVCFYSPGFLKEPLEIILSTYALSPKTEPA